MNEFSEQNVKEMFIFINIKTDGVKVFSKPIKLIRIMISKTTTHFDAEDVKKIHAEIIFFMTKRNCCFRNCSNSVRWLGKSEFH